MKIAVPKEIKNHEYRVGLIPASVRELVKMGHEVFIETNAGAGIGYQDKDYTNQGATIVNSAAETFAAGDLIIKVKEPQPNECKLLQPHQVLFTFLHLAADPTQAQLLKESGATAIAYETVLDQSGRLPLLTPMSEVAGRMAIQAGAHCLEKASGGSGVLLGGVPGVMPGVVTIIGAGVVGSNSLQIAVGMRSTVKVLDLSLPRLRDLEDQYGSKIKTLYANEHNLEEAIAASDLVIGAVLIPGAQAPKIITRKMLSTMRPGSVLVDVAIDQGGCSETSLPTTHQEPTYIAENVVHYCVTNIPGACARTSTQALNNATLPYVKRLAELGYKAALRNDPLFLNGLNVTQGYITNLAVANALREHYKDPQELL